MLSTYQYFIENDFYAQDSKKRKRNELKRRPRCLVVNRELYIVAVSVRVDQANNKGADHGAEERSPHCLERKVVADLF